MWDDGWWLVAWPDGETDTFRSKENLERFLDRMEKVGFTPESVEWWPEGQRVALNEEVLT